MEQMQKYPRLQEPARFKEERIGGYLRVSSKSYEQLASLAAMNGFLRETCRQHVGWNLVDMYVDTATGTSVQKRLALQRLIKDCQNGKITMIIVKSISRIGRNTIEFLEVMNLLKTLGVTIFFCDNKMTLEEYEPMHLTVSALSAELESRSIATNQRISVRQRMETGRFIQSTHPYGYFVDKSGSILIDPNEAKIVIFIFEAYYYGIAIDDIVEHLNQRCMTRAMRKWTNKVIVYILSNERYIGNCLYQKKYTDPEAFPYRKLKNRGEMNRYLYEDIYPILIRSHIFHGVQMRLETNRNRFGLELGTQKTQSRYAFSGLIRCNCGKKYHHKVTGKANGKREYWQCEEVTRAKKKCNSYSIRCENMIATWMMVLNKLRGNIYVLEQFEVDLVKYLRDYWELHDIRKDEATETILLADEMEQLIKSYADGTIDLKSYQRLLLRMADRWALINQRLEKKSHELTYDGILNHTNAMINQLKRMPMYMDQFDESVLKDFITEIIVEKDHTLTFILKNGIEINEVIKEVV